MEKYDSEIKMKKYLVTGYVGFVGYHFLSYLNTSKKEKISVLGIDLNLPTDFSDWSFNNLEIIHKAINLLDFDEVNSLIAEYKPTHIVHLAAFSSVGKSWQDPSGYFTNNVGIFLNIVEAVRKNGIKCRILNIGSSEEYGNVNENQIPILETTKINPDNPYAVTKMSQEGLAHVYSSGFGIDIISTRSFNHIGPRQRDVFVVASFTKQVAQAVIEGKRSLEMTTGNLNVVRDFLDVRDVVSAYYLLLEKGKSGEVYNVCSGEGVPLKNIIDELSNISGISITNHVSPDLLRPNDIKVIVGSNEKLRNDTNWERKYSLEQTLGDTLNYWKEQLSK